MTLKQTISWQPVDLL